ncbi:uncharacterized protein JN550_003893 [Neoarthrinium moseri]|uniref:uncharacterized protein n=1 Tax=Neoarthrinium moseri TaxID=1658444 RepID=UPI001FDB809A|nr:uncharacterized protein JN550_003893 [Neoarthrinium moseri]KAI1872174.1 hypothetical protein JN550_003893 [Neoarthrinium moseri]
MEVVAAVAAWAVTSVCQNAGSEHWLSAVCRRDGNATDLAGRLSPGAAIYTPGSDGFINATSRWSVFDAPTVNIVVVPATENDVAETVKYANEQDVPFLAVTGGHGAITTVGRMKTGIEIWMNHLQDIEISADGASAKIGGGSLSKRILDTLWAAGKQTVTGSCECTSLLGPGLGGGHGFLQGRHGLIADQFLSMNIVFANGSLHHIDKKTDADLWWAMQGAGHNFGIVTSVTVKIYDIEYSDWAYEMFTVTSDKVEKFYQTINAAIPNNGSLPVNVIHYGYFYNDPTIDSKGPVTAFWILQEGATSVDSVYTQPFHDLGPFATEAGSGNYLDLPVWTDLDNSAAPCQHTGFANTRFPVDMQTYDPQAMRKAYDLFAKASLETPAFNGSFFLIEGYSLQGVKAIPSDTTAVPFRDGNLLIAPVIRWDPSDSTLAQKATDLGNELRNIVFEASGQSELLTYVNYAFGDETKQNWYGFEQWRQDKLLAVKDKYDPLRKFSFYAPIA